MAAPRRRRGCLSSPAGWAAGHRPPLRGQAEAQNEAQSIPGDPAAARFSSRRRLLSSPPALQSPLSPSPRLRARGAAAAAGRGWHLAGSSPSLPPPSLLPALPGSSWLGRRVCLPCEMTPASPEAAPTGGGGAGRGARRRRRLPDILSGASRTSPGARCSGSGGPGPGPRAGEGGERRQA